MGNRSAVLQWVIAPSITGIIGLITGLLTNDAFLETFLQKQDVNGENENSVVIDSQLKGEWLGVFRSVNGDNINNTTIYEDQLTLTERKSYIEGVSKSKGVDWIQIGYAKNDLLSFAYKPKGIARGIGTYILQKKRNSPTYVGYWEGWSCFIPNIIRCPYVLSKKNGITKEYIENNNKEHLNQKCIITNQTIIETDLPSCPS